MSIFEFGREEGIEMNEKSYQETSWHRELN